MKMRRRNSHIKRTQRVAQAAVKNLAVVFITGVTSGLVVVHAKTGKPLIVNDTVKQALDLLPFDWYVLAGVAARTQLGEEYVRDKPLVFTGRYNNWTEELSDEHMELLQSVPKAQQLTAGWIARPMPIGTRKKEADGAIDEDEILISSSLQFEIYEHLGTFKKLITEWEHSNADGTDEKKPA